MPLNEDTYKELFDFERWPGLMKRKFYCSNLHYKDRACVAAFGFINGWTPELLCGFLKLVNPAAIERKLQKIRDLYLYWDFENLTDDVQRDEVEERRCRYFAFDLILGRVVDLEGHNRHGRDEPVVLPPGVGDWRNDPVWNRNRDSIGPVGSGSSYHC